MQSPYQRFYSRLPIKNERRGEDLYLMDAAETAAIHRISRRGMIAAAFVGATGVVLLYLPQYIYPRLFPGSVVILFGRSYNIPLYFLAYSGLLALFEIVLLTFLNIYLVHNTAVAAGYLHKNNKREANTQRLILNIANSKTTKAEAQYGINPMLGLGKGTILLSVALQKGKGMLSNALVKALAGRLGGRFAIQAFKNLLGIPVYAFWDAWATRTILRRARAVIMGQHLIDHLFASLPPPAVCPPSFQALLFDSLQYVATSKRYFHDNHNQLTVRLFERYGLDATVQREGQATFFERLKAAPLAERQICAMVILTGILLDERLPAREQAHIHKLYKEGIIPYDVPAVWVAHRQFMQGRPVMDFVQFA